MKAPTAATSTSGFFQASPDVQQNQYLEDNGLRRVVDRFTPEKLDENSRGQAIAELRDLGSKVVAQEVFDWIAEAERNPPFIVEQDTFGHFENKLVTSEGWRNLKAFSATNGIVSSAYERKYGCFSRIVSFAKVYLFGPSSAMVSCPLAMTDGCAKVLEMQGPLPSSGLSVYEHLISRDPTKAWMSGQWMTERPGGSDVSLSETVATQVSDDEYRVNGFKWFSSATDSQVSVVLAHRANDDGEHRDDGRLTCFLGYVQEGKVRLHRLNKKFGTTPLPTAEVQLTDMRAEIIGAPGLGVKTIASVLNITRIYSAIGSVSYWRRALYIAKQYSVVRSVFGKRLCEIPAHVHILAWQEISVRAHTFLAFYGASLMGREEVDFLNEYEKSILRIVPGLSKIVTCKRAINGVSECMEALGGVGYLEHDIRINIARLLRDTQVNAIWEGTTNVLCDDIVRSLSKNWPVNKAALEWFIADRLSVDGGESSLHAELRQVLDQRFAKWIQKFESASFEELRRNARTFMFPLADIITCGLLVSDLRDCREKSIQDKIADELASVWVHEKSGVDTFAADFLIVYNKELTAPKI
jgi:putative acyl-CoA dehydrogenase